jgi:integrase
MTMGSLYRRRKRDANGELHDLPTWWIKYRQNGRTMRESTETTKETVARRILRTREGDVEKGIPINPQMGKVTFEDAAKDLLNDYKANKKKSHDYVKRRIDLALEPAFRGKRLMAITTDGIRQYSVDRQTAGAANATINRELAALKRMFSLAIKAGKLYSRPHIPMLQEDNTRQGFFEPEQFAAVLKHLPSPLKGPLGFAFLTGWRLKSEILGLEWRQVDWNGRVIRLEPGTTKNKDGRTVAFTAALEALLTRQKADHDARKKRGQIVPLVFHRHGQRIKDCRAASTSACEKAGVPGRLPHDLRRTAVRNLERAGVGRAAAMRIVGHKTESIYRRYSIVDEQTLREAAVKIDAVGTLLGTPTETSASAQKHSA